jgi:hypothetical protein
MADNWMDWLQGSPERRAADLDTQRREYDKITSSPDYQWLKAKRDEPIYDRSMRVSVDPREVRMNAVADTLYPRRSSDAFDAEANAAQYVLDYGGRMRDTAFASAAAASDGAYGEAARLALQSPFAGAIPPMSAGGIGEPRDWRAAAEKNGVGSGTVLATELLTDPEFYVTAPVAGLKSLVYPGLLMRQGGALVRSVDDAIRLMDRARYGQGAATHLVDDAGEVIRRLRNSPPAPRLALPVR